MDDTQNNGQENGANGSHHGGVGSAQPESAAQGQQPGDEELAEDQGQQADAAGDPPAEGEAAERRAGGADEEQAGEGA